MLWSDSPYLNQFTQPDTIVPNLYDPQSLNRYAYVRNNPIRYNDPTGHMSCEGPDGEGCDKKYSTPTSIGRIRSKLRSYNVKLKGDWSFENALVAFFAVELVGARLASVRGHAETATDAFKAVYDYLNFTWGGTDATGDCANVSSGGCTSTSHQINFWSLTGHMQHDISRMVKNVVHELGHAFDKSLGYYDAEGHWIQASNNMPNNVYYDGVRDQVLRPNMADGELSPEHYDWQQHPPAMDALGSSRSETFADIFIAWTYDAWNTDLAYSNNVTDVRNYMNGLVP